jgi:hypothetical protein
MSSYAVALHSQIAEDSRLFSAAVVAAFDVAQGVVAASGVAVVSAHCGIVAVAPVPVVMVMVSRGRSIHRERHGHQRCDC